MNETRPTVVIDTRDCRDAIGLAERVLGDRLPAGEEYRLVGVVNVLKGGQPPTGRSVWELILKPTRLIPDETEREIGAGGEWHVRIDLAGGGNPVSMKRED